MNEDAGKTQFSTNERASNMSDIDADHKKTVLIASIITAALVSAVTAGYIVWRKTQVHQKSGENVQELLDKAHKTLHILEDRLEDLRDSVALAKKSDTGAAMA